MGLPVRTSCSGILCDFSTTTMGLRYERERLKLRTMLECNFMPVVIQRQLAAYHSAKVSRVIKFTSSTRTEAIQMRSSYISANPHSPLVPPRESYQNYVQSLSHQFPPNTHGAKYRFRYLYPNYNKPFGQEWVAKLKVKATPTFPAVNSMIHRGFKRTFDNLKNDPGNKSLLSTFFTLTRDLFNDIQWDQFVKESPKLTLSQQRGAWYHDPLIHQMNDPYMRIIRKLRLDVSEIYSHSWFRSQCKSKKCPHCSLDHDETLAHFFLICPAFSGQRAKFRDNVIPILNDLSLPYSISSFLGFDQRLKSKNFSKSHMSNRRRLYQETCDFLRSTGRFKFV